MDFDSSRCGECRKKCDSTNQKYQSQVTGQGDYECDNEVTMEESCRMNFDKARKLKEKDCCNKKKTEKKTERHNTSSETRCTCCRNTKESHVLGKTRLESNHEKFHLELLKNYDGGLYHLLANDWTLSKTFSPENSSAENSSQERLLQAHFLHLEGKVNYLLQLFKDCYHKMPGEGPLEQSYMKTSRSTYEGIFHLLNLNKRMCAAEEGIEKLTWILEELLNEFRKKSESLVINEDCNCSLPEDLDDTNLEQKIKSLLYRNDFLGKFMRGFLKVNLKENNTPRKHDEKSKQTIESSLQEEENLKPVEENQKDEANRTHVHKDRKSKATKKQKCCTPNENQNVKVIDKEEESDKKSPRNKLEAISEAGEYFMTPKLEREISELSKKLGIKNLKEFLIPEGEDSTLEIDSVPQAEVEKCFSQLSFEKCDTESLPINDPSKKNCFKIKLNQTGSEENEYISDSEMDVGILSISRQNSGIKLKSTKLPSRISTKHSRLPDPRTCKKEVKSSSKTSSKSNKKLEEKAEPKKNKSPPKIVNKCSSTVRTPRQKTEYPSSSRRENPEISVTNQRPMTAPHADRKQLPAQGLSVSSSKNFLKTSVPTENTKKSIIPYVKSKNKCLQIKKSFVQTP